MTLNGDHVGALVEWPANAKIADRPPAEYLPLLRKSLSPERRESQAFWHALPEGWESMEYRKYLRARQRGMAE